MPGRLPGTTSGATTPPAKAGVESPACPFWTLTRRHEQMYARSMFLAGVPVDDKRVLTLAAKLRDAGLDDTAEWLEGAYDKEVKVLALEMFHRDEILQVLVDCPEGEAVQLRAVLLKQQEWRDREGLSA